jgi:adenylate kinase
VKEAAPRFVILLGPPGAGKGTQADKLAGELRIPHVSSGDLFRDNLARLTPLGLEARRYMDEGKLVPDDLTVAMVMARLAEPDCRRGAILDGFPRTIAQAEALEKALAEKHDRVQAAINIQVPEDELVRRLSGRRTCQDCQAAYHMEFNPPMKPGVCDVCGGELIQRSDDQPETVKKRLAVYAEETAPLIDFYRSRGVLKDVDGSAGIELVHHAILDVLDVPERKHE